MTIFEMVFNLIGLVLGLALVAVLGGLAATISARPGRTISWLTPLLGAWVVLDVSAFWGIAWEVRDLLTSLWPSLLIGVVLASVYYLAAALIFPDDAKTHPNLDKHYWAVKRQVIGLVLFCDVCCLPSCWGDRLRFGCFGSTQFTSRRSWRPSLPAVGGRTSRFLACLWCSW